MPIKVLKVLASAAAMATAAIGLARAGTPNMADVWNAPRIAWHDLSTGVPEATRSGKTVMMVFHAPWCMACRQYRSVFKDERVAAASANLVMILVDADADKTANGAFSPDGTYVPRTIFLSPDGEIRKDLTGKTDPEHPHTIEIQKPDELLALMEKAGREAGTGQPAADRRASAQ